MLCPISLGLSCLNHRSAAQYSEGSALKVFIKSYIDYIMIIYSTKVRWNRLSTPQSSRPPWDLPAWRPQLKAGILATMRQPQTLTNLRNGTDVNGVNIQHNQHIYNWKAFKSLVSSSSCTCSILVLRFGWGNRRAPSNPRPPDKGTTVNNNCEFQNVFCSVNLVLKEFWQVAMGLWLDLWFGLEFSWQVCKIM